MSNAALPYLSMQPSICVPRCCNGQEEWWVFCRHADTYHGQGGTNLYSQQYCTADTHPSFADRARHWLHKRSAALLQHANTQQMWLRCGAQHQMTVSAVVHGVTSQ